MLSFFQDIVLVVITVSAAMLFMTGLNLIWPAERRRSHNELIGWQLSILGTTYAVILGFMLYTVWTNFGAADENVEQEAGALANLYTIADALPDPQRSQMHKLARAYADAAIHQDWPQMLVGQLPEQTFVINDKMWHALISPTSSASSPQAGAQEQAIAELSKLTECRRIRLLQSTSRLPGVLWCVLLIGGALTITSSCMFGAESSWLHALQVFAFSLLVALCLVAIANINRPFQGDVHISDLAFQRALQLMDEN